MKKVSKSVVLKRAVVTGSAGFIGFHVCAQLLDEGWLVCGIDALTDYYDVALKNARNKLLLEQKNFTFFMERLENRDSIRKIFLDFEPDIVIHLGAQAGVRYSIESPSSYVDSNLIGTFNVLEATKDRNCKHLLLASTSSVYGGNTDNPYKEIHKSDIQMSFYAATKKSNEVMSHAYSHLFNLPITCFRFFTVYGPWGRPDMALFKFTSSIIKGQAIDVFNYGNMKRDFTYIDDLVNAIKHLIEVIPKTPDDKNRKYLEIDSLSSIAPWRVVNIGSSSPISLDFFLEILEKKINRKINKNYLPMQPGDVPSTYADISLLKHLTGFEPTTSIDHGIKEFLEWYKSYYKVTF